MLPIILLTAIPFANLAIADHDDRSAYAAAQILIQHIPPGSTLTTGNLVMNEPELFYYSRMNVESYPDKFLSSFDLPTSRWILLDGDEYAAQSTNPNVHDALNINPAGASIVLAWYETESTKGR